MVRKFFLFALLAILVMGSFTQAAPPDESGFYSEKQIALSQFMPSALVVENSSFLGQSTDSVVKKQVPFEIIKSPKIALLSSAVIPGLGELYAKSYIMSLVFVGLEATLWGMYFKYIDQGEKLEKEFQAFADTYWSREQYEQWITGPGSDISKTHELPETNTQQYYEMIGKYDQFFRGWDDSDVYSYGGERSPQRLKYMDMREDSNIELKNATTMASVVILNHIVSAVDAAWCTYRYNKNYAKKNKGAALHIDTIKRDRMLYPALSLNVRW